jgi:hypothetical protein
MSLSQLLTQDGFRQIFARRLRWDQLPPFPVNQPIRAEAEHRRYALVGSAFDYLLRFRLARNNPDTLIQGRWIADYCAETCEADARPLLATVLEECREVYQQFCSSEDLSNFNKNALLHAVICLGAIDALYRVGECSEDLFALPLIREKEDLSRMWQIVPDAITRKHDLVILNPGFGEGSSRLQGADAAFILNTALYELKTTKYLELKKEDVYQLVAYYALGYVNGVSSATDYADGWTELTEVVQRLRYGAIYYARFGIIYQFEFAAVLPAREILPLVSEMYDYAAAFYRR